MASSEGQAGFGKLWGACNTIAKLQRSEWQLLLTQSPGVTQVCCECPLQSSYLPVADEGSQERWLQGPSAPGKGHTKGGRTCKQPRGIHLPEPF